MKNRKFKRNHYNKQSRKKENTEPKLKPYTPIKLDLFQVNNPFTDIPLEKRMEILMEIGEKGNNDFKENYLTLKNWFVEYNALYILSFCLFYFLSSPEGVDKEAAGVKLDFYHHYLELLQAFALMQRCSDSPNPLQDNALVLRESLQKIMDSYQNRSFYGITQNISSEEFKKRRTISEIRSQTVALRNNAYPSQVLNFNYKVLDRINNHTTEFYGLNLSKFFESLLLKSEIINIHYNEHIQKIANFYKENTFEKVWEAFTDSFGNSDNYHEMKSIFTRMGSDLNAFKHSLITYTDLKLEEILTFSAEELAVYYEDETKTPKIEKILGILSYSFGDLADYNPEHFILDNPVLQKPFIKLNNGLYFSSLFGIIYHLIPNIVELLVKEIGSITVKKYQKAKASILEDETKQLFEKYFPNAQIFKGSKWIDPDTGKEFENDLLVLIDRFAFIIECKSNSIAPSARRGGENRIIETLKNLVVDAAIQAKRFISYLREHPRIHNFPTQSGIVNTIDNTKVNFYIPLSVTIESLGAVSANLKNCVEAGLIKGDIESFIPSISVTDLEVIFEILENEIERIHYLLRRSQIEREITYIGDESDLLAFYLDTGFNLGIDEEPGRILLNLLLKSKELDPYFTAKESGISVSKPRLASIRWWRDIINYLIERKPQYWTEIGYVLLNVPKTEQKGFERKFKNLQARIKLGMTEFSYNWVALETLPKYRSYIIAGFPYTISNSEKRNEVIRNQILNKEVVTDDKLGAICIGMSIKTMHYPYSVLVFVPKEFMDMAKETDS